VEKKITVKDAFKKSIIELFEITPDDIEKVIPVLLSSDDPAKDAEALDISRNRVNSAMIGALVGAVSHVYTDISRYSSRAYSCKESVPESIDSIIDLTAELVSEYNDIIRNTYPGVVISGLAMLCGFCMAFGIITPPLAVEIIKTILNNNEKEIDPDDFATAFRIVDRFVDCVLLKESRTDNVSVH